ncbi:MAG: nucleotidyltransferase domain-containing protein [Candidatus Dormibacteraeota bacterium]|nr:nucleotidyltransferase domain-containing protein [Candidatus Dormibacteraeota bacterium]
MVTYGAETEKRRAIARRVVDHLAARTELQASMLAGSAALGTSDEHSDIDLLNYYEELPSPSAFSELMRHLGAELKGEISGGRPEGFGGSFRLAGVEVQTGGQLIAATERRLERIAAGDVDWLTAKVAMGLVEGLPLHGETLVRDWQVRAAYPEALRRRQLEANLWFFPIWDLDDHLAARDAELYRRQMLLDGAFRVLAVLSAVNRLYFSTFQFKRARPHIERMAVRPDQLADRLDLVANAPPSEAAEELRTLVQATKAIVRAEMPDLDVERLSRPQA